MLTAAMIAVASDAGEWLPITNALPEAPASGVRTLSEPEFQTYGDQGGACCIRGICCLCADLLKDRDYQPYKLRRRAHKQSGNKDYMACSVRGANRQY